MINYAIIRLKTEAKEIRDWFKATDYLPNKIIRGEWSETEPKWIAYKQECRVKALRLEELNKIIEEDKQKRIKERQQVKIV
jgi:hypothetical protein